MPTDSLRKRYLFKLISGLIGFAISIVMQSMISRGLGPSSYGDFSFLTSVFTQIVLFFDLGNTSGFFVKLSQRPKEFRLVSFYVYFTSIGLILFVISVLLTAQFPAFYEMVFPGQKVILVLTAAVWAILARYIQILNNITDAYGFTVKSEKGLMLQKIIGILVITILFVLHKLSLTNYFIFQYFNTILIGGLFIWIIRDHGFFVRDNWRIDLARIKEYIKEFYVYSHPMFIGAIFGYASVIADRWLLQFFAGSIEQGFYGLAYQICTVSTIFGGAMSMLIMREFSIAFNAKDLSQMAYIFRRFIPLLYSLTAYISCFTAVQSEKLIFLMAGDQYSGAYLAVAIMCFYPIHQTYGQLSGSVFLATGQTGLYAKFSVISVILGLPMLYLLIAPNSLMGFNLGASGLAFKMVIIQIVFVNIQLYYNSRLLNLNFWKYVAHQVVCLVCLLGVSIVTMLLVDHGFALHNHILLSFLLSGVIYTGAIAFLIYLKPEIFGIAKQDLSGIFQLVKPIREI